jgi:hypothetical protein
MGICVHCPPESWSASVRVGEFEDHEPTATHWVAVRHETAERPSLPRFGLGVRVQVPPASVMITVRPFGEAWVIEEPTATQ